MVEAALWIGLTAFSVMPVGKPYPLSGCLCAQDRELPLADLGNFAL
jgi:hypothetical protein